MADEGDDREKIEREMAEEAEGTFGVRLAANQILIAFIDWARAAHEHDLRKSDPQYNVATGTVLYEKERQLRSNAEQHLKMSTATLDAIYEKASREVAEDTQFDRFTRRGMKGSRNNPL